MDTFVHHENGERGDKMESRGKAEAQADGVSHAKRRRKKKGRMDVDVVETINSARTSQEGVGTNRGGERTEGQGGKKGEGLLVHCEDGSVGKMIGRKGKEKAEVGVERTEKTWKKKEGERNGEGEGAPREGRKKAGEEYTFAHHHNDAHREYKVKRQDERHNEGTRFDEKGRKKDRRRVDGVFEQENEPKVEDEVAEKAQREERREDRFLYQDKENAKVVGKTQKRGKKAKAEWEEEETEDGISTEEKRREENGSNESKGHKGRKRKSKRQEGGGGLAANDRGNKTKMDEGQEEKHSEDGEIMKIKEEEQEVDVAMMRIESKKESRRLRRDERKRRELEAMEGVERTEGYACFDFGVVEVGEKKWKKSKAKKNASESKEKEMAEAVKEKMEEENVDEEIEQGEEELDEEGMENKEVDKKKRGKSARDMEWKKTKKRKRKEKVTMAFIEGMKKVEARMREEGKKERPRSEKAEEIKEKMEEESMSEEIEQGGKEVCKEEMVNKEVEKKKREKRAREMEWKKTTKKKRKEMTTTIVKGMKVEGGMEEERKKERLRSEVDYIGVVEPNVTPGKVKKGKKKRGETEEKYVDAVDEEERMQPPAPAPCKACSSHETPLAKTATIGPEYFSILCRSSEGAGAALDPALTNLKAVFTDDHPALGTSLAVDLGRMPTSAAAAAAAAEDGREGFLRISSDNVNSPAVLTSGAELIVSKGAAKMRKKTSSKVEKSRDDYEVLQKDDSSGVKVAGRGVTAFLGRGGEAGEVLGCGGEIEEPLCDCLAAFAKETSGEGGKERKQREKQHRVDRDSKTEVGSGATRDEGLESLRPEIALQTVGVRLSGSEVELDKKIGKGVKRERNEREQQNAGLDGGDEGVESGQPRKRKERESLSGKGVSLTRDTYKGGDMANPQRPTSRGEDPVEKYAWAHSRFSDDDLPPVSSQDPSTEDPSTEDASTSKDAEIPIKSDSRASKRVRNAAEDRLKETVVWQSVEERREIPDQGDESYRSNNMPLPWRANGTGRGRSNCEDSSKAKAPVVFSVSHLSYDKGSGNVVELSKVFAGQRLLEPAKSARVRDMYRFIMEKSPGLYAVIDRDVFIPMDKVLEDYAKKWVNHCKETLQHASSSITSSENIPLADIVNGIILM